MQARVILLAVIVVTGASTIALSQAPPLTQVAISFGTTTWLEKVSDEQYRAAAVK